MRYAFYAIAFLTIVLAITLHANHFTLSSLSLFSGPITLLITYHASLEDSESSDEFDGFYFFAI